MQTLEELKAENARLEAEEAEQAQESTPDESAEYVEEVEESAIEEAEVETEDLGEGNQEEATEEPIEAWMQTGDQASDNAQSSEANTAAAAVKRKYRAKLDDKNDEIEALKAEIASLKSGAATTPAKAEPMPTLEASDYDEAKYQDKMQKWLLSQMRTINQQSTQQVQQQAQQQEMMQRQKSLVNEHYERAGTLGVDPEVYQASDLAVRRTIDSVFNGQGDNLTDMLISKLGEGSEKVMYYIGRNPAEQEKLKLKLQADPSGLDAMLYLGELKKEKTAPVKRASRAPKPAPQAHGDAAGSESAEARKLRDQYRKAEKEGSAQEMYNLRKEGKAKKFDVSNW
jgi:hypothetical protein